MVGWANEEEWSWARNIYCVNKEAIIKKKERESSLRKNENENENEGERDKGVLCERRKERGEKSGRRPMGPGWVLTLQLPFLSSLICGRKAGKGCRGRREKDRSEEVRK